MEGTIELQEGNEEERTMSLRFSVSMCVYGGDHAGHFDEALKSIFCQTRMPDEVVLVVDGPVPVDIENVISKYCRQHSILNVYRLQRNQGHGNARKYGFSKCSYDYIAIADADDINVPERFEVQMKYFEDNPDLGAVSSGCFHFEDDICNIINEERLPETDREIKKKMRTCCPICQPAVILNKSAVLAAGGYKDWYMAEDYFLWIRMMLAGAEFANTSRSLLYLRTTAAQMERRGGYKYFKSMKSLYQYMLREHVINKPVYIFNVSSRFVLQVLLPGRARALIRKLLQ